MSERFGRDIFVALAAIVEEANPPYFFKLVGPQKTLDLARSDFDKLISSLHYE